MTPDIQYIKCSVFYHPEAWGKLVAEGIKPWILKHPTLRFFLSMNEEKGGNIRLCIPVEGKNFTELITDLHKHLHHFLEKQPSPPAPPAESLSFFMDFPVNSIHYNLFHHNVFLVNLPGTTLNFDTLFSDFWKTVFVTENEEIKKMLDNRFIFSLELSIALLFCFSPDPIQVHDDVDHILTKHLQDHTNTAAVLEEMESEYVRYQNDLVDLVGETWKRLETNQFFGFTNVFKNLLRADIKPEEREKKILITMEVLKKLNHNIAVHTEIVVLYFLKRSLACFNNTRVTSC